MGCLLCNSVSPVELLEALQLSIFLVFQTPYLGKFFLFQTPFGKDLYIFQLTRIFWEGFKAAQGICLFNNLFPTTSAFAGIFGNS